MIAHEPKLDRLLDKDPPVAWQAELLALGLLAEPGPEPDDKRWDLRRELLERHRELHTRDTRKTELLHPVAFSVGGVPPAVWIAIIAMIAVLSVAFPLFEALVVSVLVLGFFGIAGLLATGYMERQRRLDLEDEEAAYRACAAQVRALAWEILRQEG